MTIYYVRKSGSDSNSGTTPAEAWLTIDKALGATGISSGDTVYIGAGVYREKVTCALTSPVAETFVIGDVSGAYTGDAGEIRITNYLTNDKSMPSTDGCLLFFDGRDYLTFRSLVFVCTISPLAETGWVMFDATTLTSRYISFIDCAFIASDLVSGNNAFLIWGGADVMLHWLFDRCRFLVMGAADCICVVLNAEHTADFDIDFIVRNCFAIVPVFVTFNGGNYTYKPGGLLAQNCTVLSVGAGAFTTAYISTSIPMQVTNCVILPFYGDYAFRAMVAGQIVEDYNYAWTWAPYTNVTSGEHTVSDGSIAPLLHFGQELMQGLTARPFGMPTANSGLLGFGDDGNAPSVDILNRPRPAGGQSTAKAVGAYERHDTAIAETSVFDVTPSIKIIGPGDHDFYIPVDAAATTISIKARYDANHAATNKPQAILLAQSELGVSAETLTMTAAANTWETLTFTQITPTAAGVVTVRLVGRSAAGNGIAYFDTLAAA